MMITRDNYESFFLDYLDGKLEENLVDEFLRFLKQNPDLRNELHLFENIHLPANKVVFPGKNHLYQPEESEEAALCETELIAYMEGDLKGVERESFETRIARHHELQKEYNLFSKTRMVADTRIKYPGKEILYRKSGVFVLMKRVAQVAAIVLILWGFHSLFQTGDQTRLPIANRQISLENPVPDRIKQSVRTQKAETGEKLAIAMEARPLESHQQNQLNPLSAKDIKANSKSYERDSIVLKELNPKVTLLQIEPNGIHLAVSRSWYVKEDSDPRIIAALEEYVAHQAKKMGGESLLSANRIIQTGLNVATELSGNRFGYKVKSGKISSIGFESKLIAFSIPLEKKQKRHSISK